MEDPGGEGEQEEMLNYINTSSHKRNLKAALDYHSVREPDLELVSSEGRKLYGHRSDITVLPPVKLIKHIPDPCWESSVPCWRISVPALRVVRRPPSCFLILPQRFSLTSSMFYTRVNLLTRIIFIFLRLFLSGSTETSSDKVQLLCGSNGVFASAKLLGIDIKADQKVIEVVDRSQSSVPDPPFRHLEESLEIVGDEEGEVGEESIVVEGEQAETMEITPQIPMFDLGHFLYQPPYHYQEGEPAEQPEEEPVRAPSPQENEDFYICKLPSCQTMIQFENCGARSKILNHYTSHFQRELEQAYGHLLSEDMQCTLCGKDLKNFIKSKIWIHIGVTHDKTNDILIKKGIEPIRVNIRMNKRKASDAFREETSPKFDEQPTVPPPPRMVEYPSFPPGTTFKPNTCKLCGQVTQNRKRLLKHYCTKHYIDRLSSMEYSFIEKNRCTICFKDFIGAKKSSKVIHIGLEHKKIYEILDEEFGVDGYLKHDSSTPLQPPLKKMKPDPTFRPIAPKMDLSSPSSGVQFVNPHIQHNMPRVEATMSERMKEIQDLGNTCHVCGKQFDLFRSMLLPHYCGHFYKEIAQGHEDYFTEVNCKLCGATATKRKSRIIHLGVKHELVLPYIEDVLRSKNILPPADDEHQEETEDSQNEFIIDESEIKSENGDVTVVTDEMVEEEEEETEIDPDTQEISETVEYEAEEQHDVVEMEEEQVVTPIRIKTISLKKLKEEEEDSGTDGSLDGVTTIGKIVKKEDPDDQSGGGVKAQNKEVWITPAKSKSEMLTKISTQQNNIDNQNRSFHLAEMFNDVKPEAEEDVEEEEVELEEEEEEEEELVEEVTPENLGLVCRFCSVTETSDYELLTHYCSHFDNELKEISMRMIDEDHKCVECHKMLGNNKRRLYHFGVKHLKVIPLINKKLRMIAKSESSSKKTVDDSADMTEEDDFEITYDNQPNKVMETENSLSATQPNAGRSVVVVNSKSGGHKNPRLCEFCGCKRNTSSNLLLHYTKQHFLEEIKSRWGHDIVENTCQLCDQYIETNIKNVGEAEKWIHLGHKHSRTNQLLMENGKSMIIIKGYNDHDFSLIPSVEQTDGEYDHMSSTHETFGSSEDEIASSPQSIENMSEVYHCSLCDKTTKNQNLLDLHLIAIHYKQELLERYGNPHNTCQFCNKQFQNVDAFAFHIGKDHDLLKLIKEQENSEEDASETSERGSSPVGNDTKVFESKVSNSVSGPQSAQPANFACFKCGAKRRGLKELYGHYSLQHFSKELMEEFGVQKKCNIEDCGRNLENGTAWVSHLG